MIVKQPKEYKVGINEIRQVTSLLKNRYDFDFTEYAVSSLQRRIIRVLGLYNLDGIDDLLKKMILEKEFHNTFIEEITVNTTEMFRAPSMWKSLRENIFEKLKTKSRIRIWHAGCSSGEEVYSMTILLKEMEIYDKVTLYATDLNTQVIESAKKGVYPIRNMELNEANYQRYGGKENFSDYYSVSGHTAKMDQSLLSNVRFLVHNLAQDDSFLKFDLILCRNVMIYFDKVLQDNVFKLFHKSLNNHAYFVIGSKESMIWCSINNKFKIIDDKEKIYQVLV